MSSESTSSSGEPSNDDPSESGRPDRDGDSSGGAPELDPGGAMSDGGFESLVERVARATRREPGDESREHATPERGAVLDDTYEIIEELSDAGGMGRVYLARDLQLGRRVVVKMVRTRKLDEDHRVLFKREARATARLNHEHIVTIHAFGFWRDIPYMVLEFLRGESLRERLEQGGVSEREAVEIAAEVVQGLRHAHEHGVLHRDIKPDNIFLTDRGEAKLLDFGISMFDLDEETIRATLESDDRDLTEATPASLGTPGYMAPEQWRGDEQDERTDVWGIGATLYTMLAERPPYNPDRPASLMVDGTEPLRDHAPEIRGATEAFVEKTVAIESEDRLSDLDVVSDRLESLREEFREAEKLTGTPFRYLEPFGEEQAGWFFGRDEETARLMNRVDQSALTAVVGPSGAGKSSLLRAGLIPRLRERRRAEVVTVEPGANPLQNLQRALAPFVEEEAELLRQSNFEALRYQPGLAGQILRNVAREREQLVVLVVEHLEQLFGRDVSEEHRRAFAAAIRSASDDPRSDVRVVCSFREDALTDFSELPDLEARVSRNLMVLGAPDEAMLRDILRGPAELAGYDWADGVVETIVEEVESDPTPLPTLQITASRVWEERDRETRELSADALERAGGVGGAVSAHADDVIDHLKDGERRRVARDILCEVVTRDGTARSVDRGELLERFWDAERAAEVLEHLVDGRLLTVSTSGDRATVELAHEALVARWDRLRRWRREERGSKQLRERLAEAAHHWEREGRPASLLWRGRLVERASDWEEVQAEQLTVTELDFLDASREAERRRGRWRWGLGVAALVAALVAGALGWAYLNADGASTHERRAERLEDAARQIMGSEPDLAVTLAGRAVRADVTPRRVSTLHRALARGHLVRRRPIDGGVLDAAIAPDGSEVVIFPNQGWSVTAWSPESDRSENVSLAGGPKHVFDIERIGTVFFRRQSGARSVWCPDGGPRATGMFGRIFLATTRCRFLTLSEDGKLGFLGEGTAEDDVEWRASARGRRREHVELGPDGRRVLVHRSGDGEGPATIRIFPYGRPDTSTSFELEAESLDARFAGSDGAVWTVVQRDGAWALVLRSTEGEIWDERPLEMDEPRTIHVGGSGETVALRAGDAARILQREGESIRPVERVHRVETLSFDTAGEQVLVRRHHDVVAVDRERGGASDRIVRLDHDSQVDGVRRLSDSGRFLTWMGRRGLIWSEDGRRLDVFSAEAPIRGLSATRGGERVVAVTEEGVEVHDFWGRVEGTLVRHDSPLADWAFDADSSGWVALSERGAVERRHVDGETLGGMALAKRGRHVAVEPGTSNVMVAGRRRVVVRNPTDDQQTTFEAPHDIEAAGWLPKGEGVWLATGEPSIELRRADGGRLATFEVPAPVERVVWDGEGRRVLLQYEERAEVRTRDGKRHAECDWSGDAVDSWFGRGARGVAVVGPEGRLAIQCAEGGPGAVSGVEETVDADAFSKADRLVVLDGAGDVVVHRSGGDKPQRVGRLTGATTVAADPSGRFVVASSPRRTRIWRAGTGERVADLPVGAPRVDERSFSGGGDYLAFPDGDGGLQVFVLPVGRLRSVARRQAARPLTDADRRRLGLPGSTSPARLVPE